MLFTIETSASGQLILFITPARDRMAQMSWDWRRLLLEEIEAVLKQAEPGDGRGPSNVKWVSARY